MPSTASRSTAGATQLVIDFGYVWCDDHHWTPSSLININDSQSTRHRAEQPADPSKGSVLHVECLHIAAVLDALAVYTMKPVDCIMVAAAEYE